MDYLQKLKYHYRPEKGWINAPTVCLVDGKYYCVMASGNPEDRAARLLLYKSQNLFDWKYLGVISEWADSSRSTAHFYKRKLHRRCQLRGALSLLCRAVVFAVRQPLN